MIKLYQFAAGYGLPNFSPFCMKLETYLRIAQLDYEVVNLGNTRRTPKGKLPFINDNGTVVADSQLAIRHLNRVYDIDLDKHLNAKQIAISRAFQGMLDEKFYWTVVYSRWIDPQGWSVAKRIFFSSMPQGVKQIAPKVAQSMVKKQLHAQGTGRHSAQEIYQIGIECIDALSDYLEDKPFIHGDEPSLIDACAFSYVATLLQSPFESAMKTHASGLDNLKCYSQTMYQAYFPELVTEQNT